jgi:arylsulfatase A-like enzyme
VPCIASWPGTIPAGRTSDELLTTLELMPTFAGVAGAKLPEGLVVDGHDMLPVLKGAAASPREEMYWEFRGEKAARIGKYKWIDSAKARGLYDLAADIGEQHDLSQEHPDIAARIANAWQAWRKEMDAAEPRGPFRDY